MRRGYEDKDVKTRQTWSVKSTNTSVQTTELSAFVWKLLQLKCPPSELPMLTEKHWFVQKDESAETQTAVLI